MSIYPPDIPIEVCDKFVELAREAKAAKLRRYSADAILHRIRWHFVIDQRRGDFKCNNNWTAQLGRWAMAHHPDLAGFFETRRSPHKGKTIDDAQPQDVSLGRRQPIQWTGGDEGRDLP